MDNDPAPLDAEKPVAQKPDHFVVSGKFVRRSILTLVVGIITLAFIFRERFIDVEHIVTTLGYPAILVMSLIGSAGLVIPFPSTAAVFFGGHYLNPVYVGLIAGVAEAIGETTGYALGYSGSGIAQKTRIYQPIERWVKRQGWVAIVVFSTIPNPIFDLLGIAAGALKYPFRKFIFLAWIGKTVKNIGIAYAGAYGAAWFGDLISGKF